MSEAGDSYECASCGGTFLRTRPDQEAADELAERFPEYGPEDCDIVCDDCFQEFERWHRSNPDEPAPESALQLGHQEPTIVLECFAAPNPVAAAVRDAMTTGTGLLKVSGRGIRYIRAGQQAGKTFRPPDTSGENPSC